MITKKTIMIFSVLVTLLGGVLVFSQTRRSKEDDFTRAVFNINETETFSHIVKACDPDGDSVEIFLENLPRGFVVSPVRELLPEEIPSNLNETCPECITAEVKWYGVDIEWTPDNKQSGEYKIYIHAVDDKGGDDWVNYVIYVADKNRPPVL
jgi:hypothetical protein